MSAKSSSDETPSDLEIVLTRVFDAPRELVWRVWTDPKHLVHWWGPDGFTTTYHESDVRSGGVSRFTMHGPNDVNFPNRNAFVDLGATS